mmetsp:Transcript_129503/g.242242  ORF Transcript_129503/g.242242 Transcript_129503/m.242242 type:complete len:1082 (+) Transcript_129503:118-3363(+)
MAEPEMAEPASHAAASELTANDGSTQRRRRERGGRSRADGDSDWRRGSATEEVSHTSRGGEADSQSWQTDRNRGWQDSGWRESGWKDNSWHDAGSRGWQDWSGEQSSSSSSRGGAGRNAGGKGRGRSRWDSSQEDSDMSFDARQTAEPSASSSKGRGKGHQKGSGRKSRQGRDAGHAGEDSAAADAVHAKATGGRLEKVEEEKAPGRSGRGGRQSAGRGGSNRSRQVGPRSTALDVTATVIDRLSDELGRAKYDCMICFDKVRREHPIWSCNNCWAAFHLRCIHKWIKQSNRETQDTVLQCPGCRYHHIGDYPEYTCFCGKVLEPDPSPHYLAHSCGEVCEKDRGCPHRCTALCHPGPCPPCTAVGPPGQCYCGEEIRETTRCGEPTSWSCGAVCGKMLSCGRHQCPLKCHAGPCPPCSVTSMQSCYCGAHEAERICGSEAFSCGNPCGMELECGEHDCERLCHPGDCGLCPRDPLTWGDRCACGATKNCQGEAAAALLVRWVGKRRRCTDALPLCGSRCGRKRESCSHPCTRTCHEGPCPPCDVEVLRECRCRRTRKQIPCLEGPTFLCTQPCRTKKSCGNHRCDAICCPGYSNREHEAHFCLLVCGKVLSCGEHVCEDFCHLGKCKPCRVILRDALSCACGAQSIEPPVVCGTALPQCNRPCGAELPCGHKCTSSCHFGEHPACQELVSRLCLGGHREMRHVRCSAGPVSCGERCGRKLPCGHSCVAKCHDGECPEVCSQPCGAKRRHCDHGCEAPCHPGSACQDLPCRRKIKVSCDCGQRVEEQLCGAFSGKSRPQLHALKCTTNCERIDQAERRPRSAGGAWASPDTEKYAADLHRLAVPHRRYVVVLEEFFSRALSGTKVTLPPCDFSRRQIAVEYARMHWCLRTSCRRDAVEGWWLLHVEAAAGAREPRPLLSALAYSGVSATFGQALGNQPCLRFCGVRGAGDEVYDLIGRDGLLGVRPGSGEDEVVAFMDRSASATAAFRRLTGQEPGHLVAVLARPGGPPVAGLRVALENTLRAPGRGGGSTAGTGGRGNAWNSSASASEAPRSSTGRAKEQQEAKAPVETAPAEVPDSWED